jgi:MYXO-CTERM domain-containing protein
MKSAERLSHRDLGHGLLSWLLVGVGLFAARGALAAEYYVSPTGSDSNPGTQASPWGTVQKAASTAAAGDTVWFRGGTYSPSAGITFSKSGTSDTNRINYFAYQGEVPKIDFSNMNVSSSGYSMGITVSGNWLHFKGIEECCLKETTFANNGFDVSGSNDTFELLNMHNNMGNGIFMGTKSGGGNLILNCDSHDNYDPTTTQGQGQNADGFGVHYQTSGATTIIRGCRAWWNSDDGYDLINQEVPVTVENSWAFGCGYATYGTYSPSSGNGNGFKMGSSKTGIRHLVQNNVAWKNKASGFYANHSSGGNTWYNNTSFQNGTQFNMLASTWDSAGNRTDGVTLTGTKVHIMRNNIGFPNKNTDMNGVDTQFNSWDLNITPAAKDFLSITDPTVSGTGQAIETTSPALGPRQADGSLPNVDFMKLAAGSAMIDKGTNVQLPFVGAAPDLGAYEYGATGGTPTGGVTAAGGATATGGATGAGGATTPTGGAATGGKTGGGGATTPTGGATTATGGKTGGGGATTATGGKTAGGGSTGAGGSTVLGGAPGTGGDTGAGGVTETGGTSGVVQSGGAVPVGGTETGGSVATGGQVATGGVPGSAGTTAPAETGGAVVTGGTSQPGNAGNTASAPEATGSSGGCSCRIAERPGTGSAGFALLGLLVLALRSRRRIPVVHQRIPR